MTRRLALCLLAILPSLSGCLSLFHEPPAVDPARWRVSDEVAAEAKSCVYVFLIDDPDPFDHANLHGTRCFLDDIGFGKCYVGQPCHRGYFADKIREFQAKCPNTRFAVVGYGAGAGAAQLLARDAAADGVVVDLLVYLQPHGLDPEVDADLGTQTITVWGDASLWCPRSQSAGDVIELVQTPRAEVPTHWQTVSMLEKELTAIAFTVPARPYPPAPAVRLVDPLPAPRDVPAAPKALPPEWQFLRLHPTLAAPEVLPPPQAPATPELPKPREIPGSRYGPARPE